MLRAMLLLILLMCNVVAWGGIVVCNEVYKELKFHQAERILLEYEWQQQWR